MMCRAAVLELLRCLVLPIAPQDMHSGEVCRCTIQPSHTAMLTAESRLPQVPQEYNGFCYVYEGAGKIGGAKARPEQNLVMGEGRLWAPPPITHRCPVGNHGHYRPHEYVQSWI